MQDYDYLKIIAEKAIKHDKDLIEVKQDLASIFKHCFDSAKEIKDKINAKKK